MRHHTVPKNEAHGGRGLLVMLLVLVAMLEFMAAGSKFLIGALRGTLDSWVFSTAVLLLIGCCYLVLARGVWTMRTWVPLFAMMLTILVVAFAALRFIQDAEPDLALALVFLLAMGANLGVLGWLCAPGTRAGLGAGDSPPAIPPEQQG